MLNVVITSVVYLWNFVVLKLKKNEKIPLIVLLILMGIIMGANTANPDLYNYRVAYDIYPLGRDFGYDLISRFFKFFGFSYNTFRLVLSFVGLLLLHQTVKKFLTSYNLFYLLYFIFPFFLDIVQVRNFFVMSILIFSIPYLLSDDKYDTFVCLGLVLIASTLHIIAVIYIPLWFFLRVNVNKKIKKIYFILIGILIAISFYRPFFACVTTPFVQFLNSLGIRGTKYFKMRGHFGYLLPWAINFMELFIIVWADNLYKNINELSAFKYSHEYEKYQLRTKYIKLVKYVNYYLMIFLPLLQFNLSFYRITRNTLLLDFMACLMVIEDSKKVNLDVRKFIMAFTFSIIVLAVFGYGAIYSNVDVLEILKNNWIF